MKSGKLTVHKSAEIHLVRDGPGLFVDRRNVDGIDLLPFRKMRSPLPVQGFQACVLLPKHLMPRFKAVSAPTYSLLRSTQYIAVTQRIAPTGSRPMAQRSRFERFLKRNPVGWVIQAGDSVLSIQCLINGDVLQFRQQRYHEIHERLPYYDITEPQVDWEERSRFAAALISGGQHNG